MLPFRTVLASCSILVLSALLQGPARSFPSSTSTQRATERAAELRLKLPFALGKTYVCDQAFGGQISHHEGFENEFAWDFAMPVGTPVLAAAHGRVVKVVQHFKEGGFEDRLKEKANEIWIDHGGGALSSYVHLAANSSLVREGQLIAAGQVIGASGNTGYSQGPHLHFAVIDSGRQSLPASFVEAGVPVKGAKCTSANDGRGCSWFQGDSTVPSAFFQAEGIELSTDILPAHAWSDQTTYQVAGRAKEHRRIAFFISDLAGGTPLFTHIADVDQEGCFQLEARLPNARALGGRRGLSFALAPIRAQGRFSSSNMLDISLMAEPGQVPKSIYLPYASGAAYRVEKESVTVAGETVAGFVVKLGEGAPVLACVGGRVLEIGTARALRVGDVPKATTAVRVDHGGGLELVYAGLDAGSVDWRIGQVVSGGAAIGTVGRDAVNSNGRLLVAVLGDAVPSFIEASGPLETAADLSSQNGPQNELLLAFDSDLPPDAFLSNGVTLTPSGKSGKGASCAEVERLAASLHPSGAALRFVGVAAIRGGMLEVLVQSQDGRKKATLGKTRADNEGAFDLTVQLTPKSLARIGDRPMRYCVRARDAKAKRKPKVKTWRPLVVVR